MEDIELVIKIPEEIYKHYKKVWQKRRGSIPESCIAFGIPLPKGHGDLVDKNNYLKEIEDDIVGNYPDLTDWIEDTQTIIPADKKSEGEE